MAAGVRRVEALTGAGSSADNPEGWGMAVPGLPDSFGGVPDLSIVGDVDLFGAFVNLGVISASLLVFTLDQVRVSRLHRRAARAGHGARA